MAFVRGFEHDAFISYGHLDNVGDGDAQGWVTEFHRRLTARVGEFLGTPIDIWRDTRLDGTDDYPATIAAGIERSALFIAIVTPRYAGSEWCQREFSTFEGTAKAQGLWTIGNRFRVVKVVRTPLPDDAHRTLLLPDALGFEFFKPDPDVPGRTIRFRIGDTNFDARLEELAQSLASLLRALAAAADPDTRGAGPAATGRTHPPTIYCAAAGLEPASTVAVVACVVTTAPDVLAGRVRSTVEGLALDPYFARVPAAAERLRRGVLRYADDDPDVRSRVADAMAGWPFDGYVSFCEAPGTQGTPAQLFEALAQRVVFDRLRSVAPAPARLLLGSRQADLLTGLTAVVDACWTEIAQKDSVLERPAWTSAVAGSRDPAVVAVDYVSAIVAQRLARPDSGEARLFGRLYPNKLRAIYDWRRHQVYSRRSPFPDTWSPMSSGGESQT